MKRYSIFGVILLFLAFLGCGGGGGSDAGSGGGGGEETTVTINAIVSSNVSSGTIPFTVDFDASSTSGAVIANYAWDFGDGTSGTGATVSHEYTTAGVHTVELEASDSSENSGTTTTDITATANVMLPTMVFHEGMIGGSVRVDSLALDSVGNVYSFAAPQAHGGTRITSRRKHDKDGNLLWSIENDIVMGQTGAYWILGSEIFENELYSVGYIGLYKFDLDGNLLDSVVTYDSVNSETHPKGMGITENGNIYIITAAYLYIYDSSLNLLSTIAVPNAAPEYDITIDSAGNFFLTSIGVVGKYDINGTLLGTIDHSTSQKADYHEIDTLDNLYVAVVSADGNSMIYKYDSSLNLLSTIDMSDRDLNGVPTGMKIDSQGNIMVLSYTSISSTNYPGVHIGGLDIAINKYNSYGEFLFGTLFGSTGTDLPDEIAVAPSSSDYAVSVSTPGLSSTNVSNVSSATVLYSNVLTEFVPGSGFSVDKNSGHFPLTVTLSANSNGSSTIPVEYNWDFGDGTTATGAEVMHTYETNGSFTPQLAESLIDGQRFETSSSTTIVVTKPPLDEILPGNWSTYSPSTRVEIGRLQFNANGTGAVRTWSASGGALRVDGLYAPYSWSLSGMTISFDYGAGVSCDYFNGDWEASGLPNGDVIVSSYTPDRLTLANGVVYEQVPNGVSPVFAGGACSWIP